MDNGIFSHCKWLTYSSVTLPTRYAQRQSHDRLTVEERRRSLPSPTYIRQQEDSHHDHIDGQFCCVFTFQRYEIENQTLTPRTAEDEEQINLESAHLTFISRKTPNNDTSSMRLGAAQRITKHGFGELQNRLHVQERWKMDSSTIPMNLLWTETALLLYAENFQKQEASKFEITNSSYRSCQDRTNDTVYKQVENIVDCSTSIDTTTRKFEVLGAYVSRK